MCEKKSKLLEKKGQEMLYIKTSEINEWLFRRRAEAITISIAFGILFVALGVACLVVGSILLCIVLGVVLASYITDLSFLPVIEFIPRFSIAALGYLLARWTRFGRWMSPHLFLMPAEMVQYLRNIQSFAHLQQQVLTITILSKLETAIDTFLTLPPCTPANEKLMDLEKTARRVNGIILFSLILGLMYQSRVSLVIWIAFYFFAQGVLLYKLVRMPHLRPTWDALWRRDSNPEGTCLQLEQRVSELQCRVNPEFRTNSGEPLTAEEALELQEIQEALAKPHVARTCSPSQIPI